MELATESSSTAAVDFVRALAFPHREDYGTDSQDAVVNAAARDRLVASLSRDLDGPDRGLALRGLCDMLGDERRRDAVARVLDSVSWEIFGLVMGCLEQSVQSSSPNSAAHTSRNNSGNGARLAAAAAATAAAAQPPGRELAEETAALSERLILEMAEVFSPKELHIMALEHLHAYSEERTVRAVLAVLVRSTQRMTPARRAKFLEAALKPALEATKRLAAAAVGTGRVDDESFSDDCGSGHGAPLPPPLPSSSPPTAEHEMPPQEAVKTAASAAMTAADFADPLFGQACAERAALVQVLAAAGAGQGGEDHSPFSPAERMVEKAKVSMGSWQEAAAVIAASNLSLAAYVGFVLSALELAAETSQCLTNAAAAAAAPDAAASFIAPSTFLASAAIPLVSDCKKESSSAAAVLARAEERLVELVVGAPVDSLDLRFVLLHARRASHADWEMRRRLKRQGGRAEAGQGPEGEPASLTPGRGRGLVGLAEAAVGGAVPWTLGGVSALAHLVACRPNLRRKWLPLVWSRRTERRLFLPYAEMMMLNKHKRVASKGLELACFVAERLGTFPDPLGGFAFDWDSGGAELDGTKNGDGDGDGGGGGWNHGEGGEEGRNAAAAAGRNGPAGERGPSRSRPTRKPRDPHRFDLAAFLQVLVDVMVTCPLPDLRSRGHTALSAFLGAADDASRFRVLEWLVERCPWPNATGLLLDVFRREIDRALRPQQHKRWRRRNQDGEEERWRQHEGREEEEQRRQQHGDQEGRPRSSEAEAEAITVTAAAVAMSAVPTSPFASALAGDFVSAQLRRACRRGPPASLLMDMDSRTGGLTLARYAYALDYSDGGEEADGAVGGRLKLREQERLRQNRRLVQGFLDQLRGAAVTANSAGPQHFRLFILEDAAEQCLQELQR